MTAGRPAGRPGSPLFFAFHSFFFYSWPSLVRPNTEELISRHFVGENRFRLVPLKRMSTENAVGCLLWLSRSLFFVFHSLPCPLGAQGKFSRGFVPKGPIWICHHSNFGFLLYFLSDRIIETNNKGGNVAHETIVNWLFFKSIFSTRPR